MRWEGLSYLNDQCRQCVCSRSVEKGGRAGEPFGGVGIKVLGGRVGGKVEGFQRRAVLDSKLPGCQIHAFGPRLLNTSYVLGLF